MLSSCLFFVISSLGACDFERFRELSTPELEYRELVRDAKSEEPSADSAVLDGFDFDLDRIELSLAGCVSCFFKSEAASERGLLS